MKGIDVIRRVKYVREQTWPSIPRERELASFLSDLNDCFDGPGTVCLIPIWQHPYRPHFRIGMADDHSPFKFGAEKLPGDGRKHDCLASARRLINAAKNKEYTP